MSPSFCKTSLALALFAVLARPASGTVTLELQLGDFYQRNGLTIGDQTVGILVADTSRDGFTNQNGIVGSTLSENGFLGMSDDRILGLYFATSQQTGGGAFFDTKTFTFDSTFNEGDALGFYFFPRLTTSNSTVSAGQTFGFFRSDLTNTPSGGTAPFVTPADGTSLTIAYFEELIAPGSGISRQQFTANSTAAVPSFWDSNSVATGSDNTGGSFSQSKWTSDASGQSAHRFVCSGFHSEFCRRHQCGWPLHRHRGPGCAGEWTDL